MKVSNGFFPSRMKFFVSESMVFVLLAVGFLLPLIAAQDCNRNCGGKKNVPFPFGFSQDCPIRLRCDEESGNMTFLRLPVLNFTADRMILAFSVNCNRPFNQWLDFFGPSYALTSRNGLLVSNCSSSVSNWVISGPLIAERLDISCKSTNVSVFANDTGEFMSKTLLSRLRCEKLLTSVAVEEGRSLALSLDFQTVELRWWLEGDNCSACSPNANCSQIRSPETGQPAFSCSCLEGFVGDGFMVGDGCQKISSSCNPSKYLSGECEGAARIGVLIGGLIAGASVMALAGFLFFFIRRRHSYLKSRTDAQRLLSKVTGSFTFPLYTYKEIEKATNGFSEKQRLGTGAYGTVYSGKLVNDELVAIKKIRHREIDGIEPVINEIKLVSSVSHPNLVRLLGCCIERGQQILVYEFMPNGTLAQHLQRERGEGLSWSVRLQIATETAHAIAHLHSAIDPPIYHRDIKSSNILLDHNFKSKVADFGLSRTVSTETSHISTAPQGTPGYLDPQYHQNFHLSDKSDVYSFGVVLVEIITAMKVVDFSRNNNEINLAALAIDKIGKGHVDEIIDPFLEPQKNAWTLSTVHKLAELAFRCLAFHRDMRPSMLEVAIELDHIQFGFDEICHQLSPCSSMSSARSQLPPAEMEHVDSKMVIGIPTERNGMSPMSVQESWFSEQSSPSSSSLLDNAVQS